MRSKRKVADSQRLPRTPPTVYKHGPIRQVIEVSPDVEQLNNNHSRSVRSTWSPASIWNRLRRERRPSPARAIVDTLSTQSQNQITAKDNPASDTQSVHRQYQSSFFKVLPLEIRQEIYRNVLLSYTNCIHILSGSDHSQEDRRLFHTPCITPSDFEQGNFWRFRDFRWRPGPWGAFHLPCDLRSSRDKMLHSQLLCYQQYGPIEASKVQVEVPPYMSLFLVCCRMYPEIRDFIYSSTTFSFIGDSALNTFIDMLPRNTMHSIRRVHLAWPTWWKSCVTQSIMNGRVRVIEDFWGHPSPSTAKLEWEELWRKVSRLGKLKNIHVTIFYEKGLLPDALLPALHKIRADEFCVEAWGPEAIIHEPTDEAPFQICYNPALGPRNPRV